MLGDDEATLAAAEPLDGPAMTLCSELADDLSIDLVAGSFAERRAGNKRLSNTCVHFGPDGGTRAVYRKIHMFDAVVNDREYLESAIFEPGEQTVVTELADGTITGLAICFDLRFPEQFAELADAGAEIVCLPSAFTLQTTEADWQSLLDARATVNNLGMVAANQSGLDGAGRPSGGRSALIAADGATIAQAASTGRAVVIGEISTGMRSDAK